MCYLLPAHRSNKTDIFFLVCRRSISYDVYLYFLNTDQESTLERLKTEFVCGWLSDVCNSHFKVFVSCLLPHPPDYARVGGHW